MRAAQPTFAVFGVGQRANRYRECGRIGEDGSRLDDSRGIPGVAGVTNRAGFVCLYQTDD